MLGQVDLLEGESACGLPVSAQTERLKRELAARWGDSVSVLSADLYGLEGAERDAVLDAMVAGDPSPFVLVDGRLVCSGAVELPAVLAALA